MPDSFRISGAALLAALISSPAFAASDSAAVEQQLNALQQALAKQQEQLAHQQQQLQMQAQEIQRLRQQLTAAVEAGPIVEQVASEVQRAKLATQESPRVTLASARPTITSADGRSSVSLRSVVQLDAAHYGEDTDRGAADFRRGSGGATANRQTAAARDLSDGAYFRRARFGLERSVTRDFTYRVLAELGGSGTEGPARINDFWLGYTGFAPFTIQVGAFSPPANMDDGI